MNIAYADPPYLGCCALYNHEHGISGQCWDDLATHERLIDGLCDYYPDGWALSLSTPSLRQLLPLCPADVRIGAWVKTFASFKPNVNPAYAWEPVIFMGGRQQRSREEPTVRDWVSCPITLQKGLTGAKPELFVWWLFDFLGLESRDTITDIYPGTGVVGRVWEQYRRQGKLFTTDIPCNVDDFEVRS
jgi:hypothetical protein